MRKTDIGKRETLTLLLWLGIMLFAAALAVLSLVIEVKLGKLTAEDKQLVEVLTEEEWNRFRSMQVMDKIKERETLTIWEAAQRASSLTLFWKEQKWMPEFLQRQTENRLSKIATVQQMEQVYTAILCDIKTVPVSEWEQITYTDSWLAERSYGGKRSHEGCDIFDRENIEGRLTVCSVSDGVIENIGWLTLGGYRVGIRTPGGLYCYYAHLSEFSPELLVGQEIKAGDVIGTMGSTGYGEEGTVGKFVVHLHFGIYFPMGEEEISINPYPILKNVFSLQQTMLQ